MGNVKKGISLVALIITIVVLIILTGAVMMTMNQGNIIGKSKEAVIKSDIANFQEELRNNILQAQLNGTIFGKDDVNVDKTVWNEIKDWIPSATEKYEGSLSIAKGELLFSPNRALYNELYSAEIQIANTYGQVDSDGVYTLKENYALDDNWVSHLPAEVTSIAIPYGVKRIGSEAFAGCQNLTNIVIPYGVETIEFHAFSECEGLTSITIPNSVRLIEEAAFEYCNGLTDIRIPSRTNATSYVFQECENLRNITIEEGANSIGGFNGCTGLTSITIPNSVTTIAGDAFQGCTGLTSILIPSTVNLIDYQAFAECTNLKDAYLDNLDILDENVFIMDDAFPSTCTIHWQ